MAHSQPTPREIKEWARIMQPDLAQQGMFIMIQSLLKHIDQIESENLTLKINNAVMAKILEALGIEVG